MLERLQDIWKASGRRYRECRDQRERRQQLLETKGDWRKIEDPDRLRTRMQRKGIAASMAASLVDDATADPAIGNLLLERIIAESELLDVSFMMIGARLARGVARVQVRASSGRVLGHGTGFLVSPHLMMTNNHVLRDAAEAANSLAQFDYFGRPDGTALRTADHRLEPGRFFRTNQPLDFTMVAVAPQSEDGWALSGRPWNALVRESGKALFGEPVNIIQHPRGEPMKVAFRQNKIVDLLDDFLHYETDTDRGSSGSQVCNDRWEIAALHHSGVPNTNDAGQILLKDGSVWDGDPAKIGQIDWVANEGVRISRIVSHLDGLSLSDEERALYQQCFDPSPLLFGEGADIGHGRDPAPFTSRTEPDGSVSWFFRVNFGPAGGEAHGMAQPARTQPDRPAAAGRAQSDPALSKAREIVERFRPDVPYYDAEADKADIDSYYDGIKFDAGPSALYNALKKLVGDTHTTRLSYRTARLKHLYPWVDLRQNGDLRNIYSGTILDPAEAIAQELERFELARPGFLWEFSAGDLDVDGEEDEELESLELMLEGSQPFNCEHVVPQSWFDKRQPMKADMHHLFTCEPDCNSFRSNIPYFDFEPYLQDAPEIEEEIERKACGQRVADKFEPEFNHSVVARATLYFLLRYPKEIGGEGGELQKDRLDTLLAWHRANKPNRYEKHRNAAIFAVQGNRNPLIDFPDLADRADFRRGFG